MKRLIALVLVVFALSLSSLALFAHSGKTDSKGGHWDHSTGTYHYHHGYEAHQHYDMDGDGVNDCLYEKINSDSAPKDTPSGLKVLLKFIGAFALFWVICYYIAIIIVDTVVALIYRCVAKKTLEEEPRKKAMKIISFIMALYLAICFATS